ncbi:hypothetical protein WT60_25835 [Burkholderia sp. MSMB617WGS]|nr:hypothetical protein WT60_25835 [Burkholderia sp. MSMB617WGS]
MSDWNDCRTGRGVSARRSHCCSSSSSSRALTSLMSGTDSVTNAPSSFASAAPARPMPMFEIS